jgi:CheY-like chemotaxis protein
MTTDAVPHSEISTPLKPKAVHSTTTAMPKRILLVDLDENSQERRADMLRQRGVEVTCADDIEHARLLWQEDKYSLVMIDATNIYDDAIAFQKSIKATRPKQLVKFLVGRPGLLSDSPLEGDADVNAGEKMSASLKPADRAGAKGHKESSFGEAVRRAGG